MTCKDKGSYDLYSNLIKKTRQPYSHSITKKIMCKAALDQKKSYRYRNLIKQNSRCVAVDETLCPLNIDSQLYSRLITKKKITTAATNSKKRLYVCAFVWAKVCFEPVRRARTCSDQIQLLWALVLDLDDRFHWKWKHYVPKIHQIAKLRFSVSRGTNLDWDFYLIWIRTVKFESLDWVDFTQNVLNSHGVGLPDVFCSLSTKYALISLYKISLVNLIFSWEFFLKFLILLHFYAQLVKYILCLSEFSERRKMCFIQKNVFGELCTRSALLAGWYEFSKVSLKKKKILKDTMCFIN